MLSHPSVGRHSPTSPLSSPLHPRKLLPDLSSSPPSEPIKSITAPLSLIFPSCLSSPRPLLCFPRRSPPLPLAGELWSCAVAAAPSSLPASSLHAVARPPLLRHRIPPKPCRHHEPKASTAFAVSSHSSPVVWTTMGHPPRPVHLLRPTLSHPPVGPHRLTSPLTSSTPSVVIGAAPPLTPQCRPHSTGLCRPDPSSSPSPEPINPSPHLPLLFSQVTWAPRVLSRVPHVAPYLCLSSMSSGRVPPARGSNR